MTRPIDACKALRWGFSRCGRPGHCGGVLCITKFVIPAEPLSRILVLPIHSGDYAALVPSLQMPEPGALTAVAYVVGLPIYQDFGVPALSEDLASAW